MKKVIVLLIFTLNYILMFANVKTAEVEVTADILQPITVTTLANVDFGMISIGKTNIIAEKMGKIGITGDGNIKVEWKSGEGTKFKSVRETLEVPIYNQNMKKIATKMTAKNINNSDILKVSKASMEEIVIEGFIEGLPLETELGDYSGEIIVRATYVE